MFTLHKFLALAVLLFATSAFAAQKTCTAATESQCPGYPAAVCQAPPAECSTTVSGIAIDAYPNVYYATICPTASGNNITFKSVPLEGGVPTTLYTVAVASGASTAKVFDGLFNSIYFQSSASSSLKRVIARQVSTVPLLRPFGGQFDLEYSPEGESFACSSFGTNSGGSDGSNSPRSELSDSNGSNDSSGGDLPTDAPITPEPTGPRDTIDLLSGLQELYFGFSKALYILPASSCGPIRLGEKADGSSSSDLFFTVIASGITSFYLGTTDCQNCALPAPLFSQNEVVTDFDVSTQYIFFGTSSGLYRTDLNGQNKVKLVSGPVTGVRVRDTKVYFNAGTSIRSINFDGTQNTRLDRSAVSASGAPTSTCQCRGRFYGPSCSKCDGQVQWNKSVPSCVAVVNGVPESCSADYQCGNPPYTVCKANKCQCVDASLSGPKCTCAAPTKLSWTSGHPKCV